MPPSLNLRGVTMRTTIEWLKYCFLWLVCRHEVDLQDKDLPSIHQWLAETEGLGLYCLSMKRRPPPQFVPEGFCSIGAEQSYLVVLKFFRKSDALLFKLGV
jgi:hypothetical protein